MKTMTSREANQDFSRAKRAAKVEPVLITERGTPAAVLLSYEEYQRLTIEKSKNLFDLLAMPGAEDIELELPTQQVDKVREIDWS